MAGAPGATYSYANGPLAGTTITSASQLNGNGLLLLSTPIDSNRSHDNAIIDLRASRVWSIGQDELTTTAGVYSSRQTVNFNWAFSTVLSDLRGDGLSALVNMRDAAGRALTQNGIYAYSGTGVPASLTRQIKTEYNINAPFASATYRFGGISIGAGIRYDTGSASGTRNRCPV